MTCIPGFSSPLNTRTWVGGDDVHAVLAPQALLDDLQVQQAEESAAEAEAQRHRGFGLVRKGRIVQLQLGQAGLEVLVVARVDRIDAR